MSLRRQDLELASERMSSDLEKLQYDSQRHDEQIDETLEAVQKEQEAANTLLQSEWSMKTMKGVLKYVII